jgi:hypothetical protein
MPRKKEKTLLCGATRANYSPSPNAIGHDLTLDQRGEAEDARILLGRCGSCFLGSLLTLKNTKLQVEDQEGHGINAEVPLGHQSPRGPLAPGPSSSSVQHRSSPRWSQTHLLGSKLLLLQLAAGASDSGAFTTWCIGHFPGKGYRDSRSSYR